MAKKSTKAAIKKQLAERKTAKKKTAKDDPFRQLKAFASKNEPLDPELKEYVVGSGRNLWIKHPLLNTPYNIPALHNWQFAEKKKQLAEAVAKKDWEGAIFTYDRPFWFEGFSDFSDKLTDVDYWRILGEIWCEIEFTNGYNDIFPELFGSARKGKENLMTKDEQKAFAALPEEIKVYRGQVCHKPLAWSWTTDKEKAKWFAERFKELKTKTEVLSGTVAKSKVEAYITRREESEIVVNPKFVKLTTK